jgi:WD40-like Beta Propeller Repeat
MSQALDRSEQARRAANLHQLNSACRCMVAYLGLSLRSTRSTALRMGVIAVSLTLVLWAAAGGPSPKASVLLSASPQKPGFRSVILYSGTWTGPTEIFAVDPQTKKTLGQLTAGREPDCFDLYLVPCGFHDPIPSPNGRFVLYRGVSSFPDSTSLWVARADGAGRLLLAAGGVGAAAWSPNSSRVAFVRYGDGGGLEIVRRDGSGREVIGQPSFGEVVWSKDGRTAKVQKSNGRVRSPDGRYVACVQADGIHVSDTRRGRVRRLTKEVGFDLSWSPDSRRLAYVKGRISTSWGSVDSGDLRVADLGGHVRTVVAAQAPYGGRITSLAWARAPTHLGYPKASPAPTRPLTPTDLLADGPVERLATDGGRVAYASCLRISVWTPAESTQKVVAADTGSSLTGSECGWDDREWFYSLAMAGDRVAFGTRSAGLSYEWALRLALVSTGPTNVIFNTGRATLGGHFVDGVSGTLAGAGSLLVASDWHETRTGVTTDQTVKRLEGAPCPCPALASSPGPLVPFDVDQGRVVAAGTNETWVLDAQGRLLRSIHVSPLAAQLSGSDLVLLLPGELRHYNVDTGGLLHVLPMPNVPAGAEPGDPARRGHQRLALEDVSRGLVAYIFDNQVQLLNLADGAVKTVGPGQLARFVNSGLVDANGARIHLVPFASLPFRKR